MNSYTNLMNICDDLYANGVTPKLVQLKTRKTKTTAWIKGNGPTPNVGLHNVNNKAGYNAHGNGAGKLAWMTNKGTTKVPFSTRGWVPSLSHCL